MNCETWIGEMMLYVGGVALVGWVIHEVAAWRDRPRIPPRWGRAKRVPGTRWTGLD